MFTDHHTRTLLARQRIDELIAQAEAGRRGGTADEPRPPRAWRIATLRLLARGLRVEREIDFGAARFPDT
jgi:hypothetical protein